MKIAISKLELKPLLVKNKDVVHFNKEQVKKMENNTFVDVEFAIDTKTLLVKNKDVVCSEELKAQIDRFNNDELLEVVKTINSHITIEKITVVNEDFFSAF
jgi:hypothetical protein